MKLHTWSCTQNTKRIRLWMSKLFWSNSIKFHDSQITQIAFHGNAMPLLTDTSQLQSSENTGNHALSVVVVVVV